MTVPAAVGQWTMNTSTGSQDLSIGGLTETIKACKIFAYRCTTVGTVANEASESMGYAGSDGASGSNSFVLSMTDQDASATGSVVSRASKDGSIIRLLNPGATTVEAEATFTSFGAGKITMNVTTAPASAYLIFGVFFYGDNLSTYCSSVTPTATGLTAITAAGFKPHIVFSMTGSLAANSSNATKAKSSFGVATVDHSDDSTSEWYIDYKSVGGSPTSLQNRINTSVSCIGKNLADSTFWASSVVNPDSLGWDFNITNAAPNVQLIFLALNLGTVGKADCGIDTITEFTRDQYFPINFTYDTVGSPSRTRGYKPGAFGMYLTKSGTTNNETGNEMRCIGFTDGTNEYAGAVVAEDNVTTSNTVSLVMNRLAFNANPGGTTLDEVQLDSFTQDGLIYNNSKDSFLEYYYGWWAIKQYGETIPANSLLYATQQDGPTDKIEWKLNTGPTSNIYYYDILNDGTLYAAAADTWTSGAETITLDVYINNASTPTTLTTTINPQDAVVTERRGRRRARGRW